MVAAAACKPSLQGSGGQCCIVLHRPLVNAGVLKQTAHGLSLFVLSVNFQATGVGIVNDTVTMRVDMWQALSKGYQLVHLLTFTAV